MRTVRLGDTPDRCQSETPHVPPTRLHVTHQRCDISGQSETPNHTNTPNTNIDPPPSSPHLRPIPITLIPKARILRVESMTLIDKSTPNYGVSVFRFPPPRRSPTPGTIRDIRDPTNHQDFQFAHHRACRSCPLLAIPRHDRITHAHEARLDGEAGRFPTNKAERKQSDTYDLTPANALLLDLHRSACNNWLGGAQLGEILRPGVFPMSMIEWRARGVAGLTLLLGFSSAPAMAASPGGSGAKWVLAASEPNDQVTVVRVTGDARQMGWWYGYLLAKEISDNFAKGFEYTDVGSMAEFGMPSWLLYMYVDDIIWPGMEPNIPQEFKDELEWIAKGAQDAGESSVTLRDLRRYLAIIELCEFNCSAICATSPATDGRMMQTRVLDFGLEWRCQDNPVITVYQPTDGPAYCNVGFAGLTGSLAGLSHKRIGVCEVGLPTVGASFTRLSMLRGIPMTMLMKQVLAKSQPDSGATTSLEKAIQIIQNAPRTSNYGYAVGDGDANDARSFITTRTGCYIWGINQQISWNDPSDPNTIVDANLPVKKTLKAVPGITYLPHNEAKFFRLVDPNDPNEPNYFGRLHDPNVSISIARQIAMDTNLMNVIYDLQELRLWVAYAEGPFAASTRSFVEFDFGGVMPNPMAFGVEPNAQGSDSILMQAVPASTLTPSGVIEYSFESVGNPNDPNFGTGHSSGWQTSVVYTDTGLEANRYYAYSVKSREASSSRETQSSSSVRACTEAEVPPPPTISNITLNSLVIEVSDGNNPGDTVLALYDKTRKAYVDASGNTVSAAIWRTATAWGQVTVRSLQSGKAYEFVVRARNRAGVVTADSVSATGTTLSTGPSDPNDPNIIRRIIPDPMTFSSSPEVISSTAVTMRATDANVPVKPARYFFEETTKIGGGDSSYWQTDASYTDIGLMPNTRYAYRVRAKDSGATPVMTAYSEVVSVVTWAEVPYTPSVSYPWFDSLVVAVSRGSNPSGTELAIFDQTRGAFLEPNGTLVAVPAGRDPNDPNLAFWLSDEAWGFLRVSGLQSHTTYKFFCLARNADHVVSGPSSVGSGTTISATDVTPAHLEEVIIEGPNEVAENTVAGYRATGLYTDATIRQLRDGVIWSTSTPVFGLMDNQGKLHVNNLDANQVTTVYAEYSDSGSRVRGEYRVNLVDVPDANVPDANSPVDANQTTPGRDTQGLLAMFCPTSSLMILLALTGGIWALRRRSA